MARNVAAEEGSGGARGAGGGPRDAEGAVSGCRDVWSGEVGGGVSAAQLRRRGGDMREGARDARVGIWVQRCGVGRDGGRCPGTERYGGWGRS